MKIVSKFRDYYDGLMSHESQLVWRRERMEYCREDYFANPADYPVSFLTRVNTSYFSRERETFNNWRPINSKMRFNNDGIHIIKGILGFCGKIYPIFETRCRYFCTESDLLDFARINYEERPMGRHDRDIYKWLKEPYFNQNWNHYYDKFENSYRYPVWFLYNEKMVINPNLEELGFSKIKKNFEAFQELEMWLGNYAPPDLVPALSNEDNIERLGHDLKQSFRHRK